MFDDTDSNLRLATNLGNWRTAPFNRWSFHNAREIVPTANVPSDTHTWTLPRSPMSFERTHLADRFGATRTLAELFTYAHTDAFIVVHRGVILDEHYLHGMLPDDPHILMSVSKSVTAALAGILTSQGLLKPEALLTDYIPELAGTGFDAATLQQLLDMRVGLDFVEDYYVTEGPMIRYREATGWNPRSDDTSTAGLQAFLLSLERDRAHGGAFQYTSPNSDLLGWILERRTGRTLAQLMSDLLWKPMGAEFDAYITVDGTGGSRAAGGINVCLRDLARLGLTMLQNGQSNARQVLPASWVRDTTRGGDREAWVAGNFVNLLPDGRYRNKWYQVGDELDAYCAIGIHGQFLYVAPQSSTVIAHFASHPEPFNEAVEITLLDAFQSLARTLKSG